MNYIPSFPTGYCCRYCGKHTETCTSPCDCYRVPGKPHNPVKQCDGYCELYIGETIILIDDGDVSKLNEIPVFMSGNKPAVHTPDFCWLIDYLHPDQKLSLFNTTDLTGPCRSLKEPAPEDLYRTSDPPIY